MARQARGDVDVNVDSHGRLRRKTGSNERSLAFARSRRDGKRQSAASIGGTLGFDILPAIQ